MIKQADSVQKTVCLLFLFFSNNLSVSFRRLTGDGNTDVSMTLDVHKAVQYIKNIEMCILYIEIVQCEQLITQIYMIT